MTVQELLDKLLLDCPRDLEVTCREPYYGANMLVENLKIVKINEHVTQVVLNANE